MLGHILKKTYVTKFKNGPRTTTMVNSIQENKDYPIIVNISPSDPTKLDSVQVRCGCTRKFTLGRKTTGNQPWQIGNWTRHFTSCSKKESATRPIRQFFQPNEANKQSLPSTIDDLALETDFLLHELSQYQLCY